MYIYIYIYILMMPFFNRNWVGACGGRWAGPGSMAGWAAGSGRGTPLQKQERRGVGEGFARGHSDANVSFFLREKRDCLEGECVTYVCVPFTDGVAMYL